MNRKKLATLAACVVLAARADADELRLKTRTILPIEADRKSPLLHSATQQPKRISGRRLHWIVQFESAEPPFEEWLLRGAQVISHIPVNGYILSIPDGMNWEGLEMTYRSPIDPSDKISPAVAQENTLVGELAEEAAKQAVILRFHKDVEAWEATGILEAEGVETIAHGSLETQDMLARLPLEKMRALSLWDEVEYIFPAPENMAAGDLFLFCAGATVNGFDVAMLATPYGEGWDGSGKGSAKLTYSFGNIPSRLDAQQTKGEVRRALDEWSRIAAVGFSETAQRGAPRNLDILFASGDHGDPYPFRSGSGVLAHSFYPSPPNPEPIAGDIHINEAFGWSVNGQWDIYSVVLHEAGHSLGIGHTDVPASVMYPYYQRADTLKAADIDSIRQIYAAPGSTGSTPAVSPLTISIVNPSDGQRSSANSINFNGSLSGAAAGARVDYRNESSGAAGACLVNSTLTTWSCAAVPLQSGENRVLIQASLPASNAALRRSVFRESAGDVQLSIAATAATNAAADVRITGTASHPGGIASVKWSSNRGPSGNASGTDSWSATIPLSAGANEISITALARSGTATTKKIGIERTGTAAPAAPANPTTEDKIPPRMTIQQPIGSFIITSANKLTFRGAATDNSGVSKVTWTNSAGDQSGAAAASTANGSTNWLFAVEIAVGFNAIQIRAWDQSGNSTMYSTTVRRY